MIRPHAIAVVGGGIIGMSIAWRLAQRGMNVTVFEKGQVGGEASWAAAGMLSPGGELTGLSDSKQAEIYIRSRRQYKGFVEELTRESASAIDYLESGAIDLAYSPEEWAALRKRAETQRSLGIASREITPEQVRILSPHVQTEQLTGALFYAEDGIVAPRDLTNALKTVCHTRGVELRERTVVEEIEFRDRRLIINGRHFSAGVVAAGAWSGNIRARGVPPLPPTEPVKGHLLGFDLQLGACPTIIRHGHIYIFQRGSGFVVAGSSTEHVGFERAIDASVSEQLFRQVTRVLPVLEKVMAVDVWTGFRPKADRLYLEPWHSDILFLAYGHYRNGILLAPASADRIVDEMMPSLRLSSSSTHS